LSRATVDGNRRTLCCWAGGAGRRLADHLNCWTRRVVACCTCRCATDLALAALWTVWTPAGLFRLAARHGGRSRWHRLLSLLAFRSTDRARARATMDSPSKSGSDPARTSQYGTDWTMDLGVGSIYSEHSGLRQDWDNAGLGCDDPFLLPFGSGTMFSSSLLSESVLFPCFWENCALHFTTWRQLRSHLESHRADGLMLSRSLGPFRCRAVVLSETRRCRTTCANARRLLLHYRRVHDVTQRDSLVCCFCPQDTEPFSRVDVLKRHIANRHRRQ